MNSVRLRRIFDLFDSNGDNEITVEELGRALGQLGMEAELEELRSTVACYIKPGHSGLEFDDFESLHRSLGDALFGFLGDEEDLNVSPEQDEEDLTEAFKVFDVDGDGFISAWELQTVLDKLGLGSECSEPGRAQDMICSFDRNADGMVDFGEFKYMMRSISLKGACA